MKNLILILLIAMMGAGCGRKRNEQMILNAPITQAQLDKHLQVGMAINSLRGLFGEPEMNFNRGNGVEEWLYPCSIENLKAPVENVSASFVVAVSNEAVISWRPSGTVSIQTMTMH